MDLTDVYPTIAEAAGIAIPNVEKLDGISFWPQALGDTGEPRRTIHRWFIGNNTYEDENLIVRFAFNKQFKRYAPSENFPAGRFFDLRSDLLEREGDRHKEFGWGILRYSGLDITALTAEQRRAYDALGLVLNENELVPVNKLEIIAKSPSMRVGEAQALESRVLPKNARRSGVIWESSDPSVITVDKFGVAQAHRAGRAEVTIYSWDDAEPVASNRNVTYRKTGIKATQKMSVSAVN